MSLDFIVRDAADFGGGIGVFDYAAKFFKIYEMVKRDIPDLSQDWYVEHARARTRNYYLAQKSGTIKGGLK